MLFPVAKSGNVVMLDEICDSGAIGHIVGILDSRVKSGKVEAAGLIGQLAQDSTKRIKLVEAGVVARITQMLLTSANPQGRAAAASGRFRFRVYSLGFRVWVLGSRAWVLGFRVEDK